MNFLKTLINQLTWIIVLLCTGCNDVNDVHIFDGANDDDILFVKVSNVSKNIVYGKKINFTVDLHNANAFTFKKNPSSIVNTDFTFKIIGNKEMIQIDQTGNVINIQNKNNSDRDVEIQINIISKNRHIETLTFCLMSKKPYSYILWQNKDDINHNFWRVIDGIDTQYIIDRKINTIDTLKSSLYLGIISLLINHEQPAKFTKITTHVHEYIQKKGYHSISSFNQFAFSEDKLLLIDHLYLKSALDIQNHEGSLNDFLLFYDIPTRFFYFHNISLSMLNQIDSQQKVTPKWSVSNVVENKLYKEESLYLPIGIFSFNHKITKFVLVQPKKTTFTILESIEGSSSQAVISAKEALLLSDSIVVNASAKNNQNSSKNSLPPSKTKIKIDNRKQLNRNYPELSTVNFHQTIQRNDSSNIKTNQHDNLRDNLSDTKENGIIPMKNTSQNFPLMDYSRNNEEKLSLTNYSCSALNTLNKTSNKANNEIASLIYKNNVSYFDNFNFSSYYTWAFCACALAISYYVVSYCRDRAPVRTSMLYHLMAYQLQNMADKSLPPVDFVTTYGHMVATTIYDAIMHYGDTEHLPEFM
ncbi:MULTISPECIES: hypothetical protein [Cysteiniphilum]|uniref:Uncharacterized protein n=1 Tax=Cysteiniphilum litorale TaxID=2056700 RepID=A0A8J3E917_9GAMM|nr:MULTISPECIES: hypothetical protein [Cysteiniphilum]GGF98010.1 hypothetical protein GCM10010995_14040 [Cysteiniphilum litorale]